MAPSRPEVLLSPPVWREVPSIPPVRREALLNPPVRMMAPLSPRFGRRRAAEPAGSDSSTSIPVAAFSLFLFLIFLPASWINWPFSKGVLKSWRRDAQLEVAFLLFSFLKVMKTWITAVIDKHKTHWQQSHDRVTSLQRKVGAVPSRHEGSGGH